MVRRARFGVVGGIAAFAMSLAVGGVALAAGSGPVTFADMTHQRAIDALEADPTLKAAPEVLLVRYKSDTHEVTKDVLRQMIGGTKVREFGIVPGLEQVQTRIGVDLAVQVLKQLPHVEYAEPDYVVRTSSTPNDTYFSLQWGMRNTGQTVNGVVGTAGADVRAVEAWGIYTGDPNFVVAVIDTGMQLNHPDLAANLWFNPGEIAGNGVDDDGNGYVDDINGWYFYNRNNNTSESGGHGTHTAGTVGAVGNNSAGVTGMAWRCKIMPLKFLGPNGGYTSDAILAVQYATNKGVKVSNNSWGGGGFSQGLYDAINASKGVGHVFVAAAGNGGSDQIGDNNDQFPYYPASYNLDNIISVAAIDSNDNRATFSNYGVVSVDLGAPGVNIASTYINSNYVYNSGTSMAAPHVAGVAALVYGMNPSWTYQQVRTQILSTVRPTPAMANITASGGVLNAAAALGGESGPVNTPPTVSISSPANGSNFVSGTSITFSGASSDQQDGNLSAGLVWTSSLQGQIGTGASFSRSDLVTGTHTITAASTDSGGLSGSASVQVTVSSPSTSPPAAPSGATATNLGGGSARVAWADNSSNEQNFEIQRETRQGNRFVNPTTAGVVGENVTFYVDTPGTGRYRYRVRAVNNAGASAWSNWAEVHLR